MTPPRFGHPREHFRALSSTSDRARELASAGAASGTVVTADEQSAGRGRHGRTWSAPPGKALLCSAILSPLDERHSLLPLAVPLAVCDAAESLGAAGVAVKWPNDVWVDGRKVAGVLIEARPPEWAVIGVGINVAVATEDFPPELRDRATSLPPGATVEDSLSALCAELEQWVEADPQTVLDQFRRRDVLLGREIAWMGAGRGRDGTGVAEGVDERGNLLVRTSDGEQRALGAGEVHLKVDRG